MTLTKLLNYLPRGTQLNEDVFQRRHKFLLVVLALHLPVIFVFGLSLGHSLTTTLYAMIPVAVCVLIGARVRRRRVASFLVTVGLVYTAAAFVVLSYGTIEAHFHFFVIIGLIALYQDWVPFMWNIVFTVFSHGLGSAWSAGMIFNHLPGQNSPWLWSLIHASAVCAACIGVVVFWRETEDEQRKTLMLTRQLADAEINQRKFTSELLVNLARRNQSMLYRQLDILNQLEEKERDPDALGELFRLDHLATRIRRNAESLLVLSGEEPTRVWSEPVRLIDVVRAAIAETEDLDRVAFAVDERMEVLGHTVTDLTHVLAELTENAVRFSPPEANVTIRTRPYLRMPGAAVLTVEDWGVGMRAEDMAAANDLLAHPRDVDLSVSQRLGLHVVARLAARHHIQASLTSTPGTGVTAVVVLPAELFASNPLAPEKLAGLGAGRRLADPATAAGPRSTAGTPSTAGVPSAPTEPTEPSAPTGPAAPPQPVAPATPAPDIPMPRRSVGARNGNSSRGLHARHQRDDKQEWTGWWTPTRMPTVQATSYQVTQVTAEPVIPQSPPASNPAPPALPAGPTRPADWSSPAVVARGAQAQSPESPAGATIAGPDGLLSRRIPQANLAPELRRSPSSDESVVAEPTAPPPDAERARDALSRFQASQQAAKEQVGADGSSSPPAEPAIRQPPAEPAIRQPNGTGRRS
ncbi:MAG: ATP-binding protein [Pseudonocardiaceae bacterium]